MSAFHLMLVSCYCLIRSEHFTQSPQIEEHLGLYLPFTAIFEHPTLRALAAHLLLLLHSPGAAPIGAQVRECAAAAAWPAATPAYQALVWLGVPHHNLEQHLL